MSPAAEISLTWSAASDPESYVAGYDIYRNGISIGTSTTTSFVDATIAAGTNYTYTVAAVNRDGYASAQSAGIEIALPSMLSNDEPTRSDRNLLQRTPTGNGSAPRHLVIQLYACRARPFPAWPWPATTPRWS